MSLNKRASSWYPTFIVVAGLIALTACWLILLNKGGTFEKTLGEPQFMLIDAYQKGENYMMFMDQAGKYSANLAAVELASNGGHFHDSLCGSIDGYAIWNTQSQDCYPEESAIEASYGQLFTKTILQYTSIYINDTADLYYSLEYLEKEPLSIIAKPNRATDMLIYPDGTTSMVIGGMIDYNFETNPPEMASAVEETKPGEVG
jgi:hypothetical protein